jgi:hypothetical protein
MPTTTGPAPGWTVVEIPGTGTRDVLTSADGAVAVADLQNHSTVWNSAGKLLATLPRTRSTAEVRDPVAINPHGTQVLLRVITQTTLNPPAYETTWELWKIGSNTLVPLANPCDLDSFSSWKAVTAVPLGSAIYFYPTSVCVLSSNLIVTAGGAAPAPVSRNGRYLAYLTGATPNTLVVLDTSTNTPITNLAVPPGSSLCGSCPFPILSDTGALVVRDYGGLVPPGAISLSQVVALDTGSAGLQTPSLAADASLAIIIKQETANPTTYALYASSPGTTSRIATVSNEVVQCGGVEHAQHTVWLYINTCP